MQRVVLLICAFAMYSQISVGADLAAPAPSTVPAPMLAGPDYAAEIARVQTGGRVLDVRPALTDKASAFEVRVLLDEGRVRRVLVDVESGSIRTNNE